jgi:hypothetical protein
MNKKTVAHRDIRKTRLWRNFFLLYSASLAALYIALSMSGNVEQPLFYGATLQIDSYPDAVTSETNSSQIPETRLASY